MWHGIPITVGVDTRDKWLEARRAGIGASDVAGIVGLSPYTSPYQVWASKVYGTSQADNESMRWGRLLEDAVISAFCEDRGMRVEDRQLLVRHPEIPWAMATIDGIAYETGDIGPADGEVLTHESPNYYRRLHAIGGVQAKTDNSYGTWDELPDHIRCQTQWEMFVTGLEHTFVPVLHGGRTFKVYEEPASSTVQQALLRQATKFWVDHIESGVAPEVDAMDGTTRVLSELWEGTGDETELSASARADLKLLLEVRRQKKRALDEETRLTNRLKSILENDPVGTVNGRKVVSWIRQSRKGYYVEPSEFRSFRISKEAENV